MRIIPGNTRIKIEIFRGITLWDMLVGAIAIVMLALILLSTLPFKAAFASVHICISVLLLAKLDKESNYMYLIHMIRHFGFKRKFDRMKSDEMLFSIHDQGDYQVNFDYAFPEKTEETAEEPAPPTKEELKQMKKAAKAERKADDRLLKSKTLTKEEEDAIWLKRANQSAEKKRAKTVQKNKKRKSKENWAEMEDLSAFTGIDGGFIQYGTRYYGTVIEIPCVEFRFFSEYRRANAIENGLGQVLRSTRGDYCTNIVKIERPIEYTPYLNKEYEKLDILKKSYEEGFISEDELKSRIAVVYDRLEELMALRDDNKVVIPFYYICLFDSDRTQLRHATDAAVETLKMGEMDAKRLNDKELAVFLRYTNELDFNEHDIDKVDPKDYATWAMPQTVEMRPRVAVVNGMATHNFRVIGYPTMVWDGWLASLMTYPSTKVVVKMKPMDSTKAITSIDKTLSELRATISSAKTDSEVLEAQNHMETLQLLLTSLQSDNEVLLDVNIYVTAYDPVLTRDNPRLDNLTYDTFRVFINNMKRVTKRAWSEAGFRLNNMEFNQTLAYIGSQISGYDPMSKEGRGIPSNTVAACFPWVFPHVMDENGVKLGTSDGVPVFVDFYERNSERVNSNMVIIGKSGSGKSYATKTLLTNLAADDAKIFILDPEDEYTLLAKNLGGKFINVANASNGRLNPFHIIANLEDEEEGSAASSYSTHLQFLEEFFRQILPDCDKDSLEYLNSLVDRVYAAKGISAATDLTKLKPSDYPIFDDLYDEILKEFQRTSNEYIRTMLRTLMNYVSKFSQGGRNSIIWDGPSTVTTEENFTVFNFQSLLANRNSTVANAQMLLVLKYIDNEIIKNRDYNEKYGLNRKIVVVIDEAHVFIDSKYPVALDFMFQLAKRIRKYNGMQIVITQNIKDFVGSEEIARKSTAIINACQYSFIFALAPNDMADLCTLYEKAGGINEREQEQIVQAPRGQAFTIMSPTSRTSFKVVATDAIRSMFTDSSYANAYFEGIGGDENWVSFLGDSAAVRSENVKERTVEETVEESADAGFVHVVFDEIDEADHEASLKAAADEQKKITLEEIDDSAFNIPPIPETPEDFEKLRPAPVQVQTPAAAPAAPSKTEELLAQLTLKLGTESLKEEIKKAVQAELGREALQVPAAARPEPSPLDSPFDFGQDEDDALSLAADLQEDEDSGEDGSGFDFAAFDDDDDDDAGEGGASLGSIFSFSGFDDLTEEDAQEIDAEMQSTADIDDDDDDGEDDDFDILSFLAMQADEVSDLADDSVIEEFINGSETVADVSLEQLISYNKKNR